jgi:hypothetical protein
VSAAPRPPGEPIKRRFNNHPDNGLNVEGEHAMRGKALTVAAQGAPWAVHILAAALLLFSVGVVNGRPAFFGDTSFYYSQGEYLATTLGYPPLPMTKARRADLDSVIPGSRGFDSGHSLIIAKARSPIYGLFFFLCERLGGLWLLVFAQCWIAAWIIALTARVMAPRAPLRAYWSAAVLLTLGSSLPFYADFAMPDVFAGFAVLGLVVLTLYRDRLSRLDQAGVWALLAFAAAAHTANALLVVGVGVAFAALSALRRRPLRPLLAPAALAASAVAVALALTAGAGVLYQRGAGAGQSAPPFLMAKVLEDGPGRAYLAAHCPGGAAPTLCALRPRPMTSAEDFLWSWAPDKGMAMVVSPQTVVQLKHQEPAFVMQAVIAQPWPELRAAAAGWAQQLALFQTLEPLHNPAEFLAFPWWVNTSIWTILPGHAACQSQPRRCQPRLSALPINILDGLVLLVALAAAIFAALSSDLRRSIAALDAPRRAEISRGGQAALLLGLAILANAAVCGILSSPFPRYEARLIWTAPLIAWLVLSALPWRRARQP